MLPSYGGIKLAKAKIEPGSVAGMLEYVRLKSSQSKIFNDRKKLTRYKNQTGTYHEERSVES